MYIYIFLITRGLVKNLRKLLMIDETTKDGTMNESLCFSVNSNYSIIKLKFTKITYFLFF